MTRWIVKFDDAPGMLFHRKKHGAAHLKYLSENADKVLIGGGLRPVPDAPYVGGLWVVEVEIYEEVIDLVLNDPYYCPDHRRFSIFAWGKAIDTPVTL